MPTTAHTPGRPGVAPAGPPWRRPARLLALAALAGGLLGLTACVPALAQGGRLPGPGPGGPPPGPPPNDLEFRLVQQMLRGAADALGLTEQDLLTPGRARGSLADVAASRGVAPDTLLAAMTAAGHDWVAAEVDAGRLGPDEATALLARSDRIAVEVLTFAPPPPSGAPGGAMPPPPGGFPLDAPPPPPGAMPPPGMPAPPR